MILPEPLQFLADNWRTIASEAAVLRRDNILGIDRDGKTHEQVAAEIISNGKAGWVKSWGADNEKWLTYGLVIEDKMPLGDCAMPKTAALLKQVRGLHVAALSLFKPDTILGLHFHPEMAAARINTFHLGLIVPENCCLGTNGEFIKEANGRGFVFDGGKPHLAFNASREERVILYCEFYPEILHLTSAVN
jgi:aspartyl/asparaginyl beta-hydroxylase (cupin superfamily)